MQWQYKNISTSFRPLFIPQVPKSVEFVRMRGKTDEKIVLTDLRFRVRTRATQADRWGLLVYHNEDRAGLCRDRVGAVTSTALVVCLFASLYDDIDYMIT